MTTDPRTVIRDRVAEVLESAWVPSVVVYGTDEPDGYESVREWAIHTAQAVIAAHLEALEQAKSTEQE